MFLSRVYKQWKLLFWLIIIAISAQFFFMVKGIENIPFFLYHMYSYAHQSKDSFNVILVKTPDGYMNPFELSGRESEMLMNNVPYFIRMNRNNKNDQLIPTIQKRFSKRTQKNIYNYLQKSLVNDSNALLKFTDWWQRYFKTVYPNSYDSVLVISGYIYYQPNPKKSPMDSIIFAEHLK